MQGIDCAAGAGNLARSKHKHVLHLESPEWYVGAITEFLRATFFRLEFPESILCALLSSGTHARNDGVEVIERCAHFV